MTEPAVGKSVASEHGPSSALVFLFAVATGALVANLYYAQPLIADIGPAFGIRPDLAGSVVSLTQIGYGVGLFFLVSLADLVENRRLVLVTLGCAVLALIGAATAGTAAPFFLACFVIGVCSTGAQVLVPLMAHLAPEARRGRLVGRVMAGLLTGIMLARPVALFIAAGLGWRAVFWGSAALMLAIGVALARMMPRRTPPAGMHYGRILASMAGLLRDLPALRWRAAYQTLMFAAFSMFWTAVPLMLADHFGLGESDIGLFALIGTAGALAAPVAGYLGDKGHERAATAGAMIVLGVSFYATGWASGAAALVPLVVLTALIDAAVQVNMVISQRIIFSVPGEIRGRVNALYMTIMFMGGAVGSLLATITYHGGSWTATAGTGAAMGILMLVLFGIETGRSAHHRKNRKN